MTPGLVLVLLIAGTLMRMRGHRRTAAAMFVVAVSWVLLAGSGLASRVLLSSLQEPAAQTAPIDWPEHAAIVVLGVGVDEHDAGVPVWAFGRLVRAAALLRECRAVRNDCLLFISGGARASGHVEADAYATELRRMGVDARHLVLERTSRNTWENARNTTALLHAHDRDAPVLVTSAVHMRRSLLYFAAFDIRATGVASDYLECRPTWFPAALNIAMADLALHEYIGMLRYLVYDRLGLND